ncbi:hypothetical protein IC582_008272 [Cucumis melo]
MVKQLLFRNNTSISRQELKTAFNYHFKSCIDEEELVKLANLYFLYNVLIPRQNHNMLDDKEKFRNYPWGRLCFSLTKQFIQNAVKSKRKSKNSETESKAYAFLQGFPMVLAYWAYEIPPQLASRYVTRIGKGCPRILNWESNSIGKILKITSFWKKGYLWSPLLHQKKKWNLSTSDIFWN